jgi:hypothetical protein
MENEFDDWTKKTDNFSFAALADLVISVKCLGYSLEESCERLKVMAKANPSSEEFETKIGLSK